MLPVVHPVVGYLCYAGYTRVFHDESPVDDPALVAIVGALLPDLIDKPLWLFGTTPVGRRFLHSLLVAVPLIILVSMVASRQNRHDIGVAFAIGYVSHLVADIPWHLLAGDYNELGFLLWPLTQMPEYTGTKVLATLGSIEITTLWLEAIIVVIGVWTWWNDGRPGLSRVGM